MPNHVRNILKMKGITELPLFSEGDYGEMMFDFNKVIPMPESLKMESGSKEQLAMGGMTYENVSKLLNLPGLDDMDYDPAGVYQSLTGTENESATAQDCMAFAFSKLPAMKRQVLIRLFVLEKKPEKIARELGCSVQNVYNQRSLALKRLRAALEGGEIHDQR